MKKIFLVEDDRSLGLSLFERLSKDYFVVWVKSCAEAMEKIQQQKDFDLMILDVGLPDGNGLDLSQKIAKVTRAPFLFLTAQADAESRLKGYQLGAEEFIPKPFHLKELLMRLDRVLKAHAVSESVEIKNVRINFSDLHILNEKKEKVYLTSSEMRVLEILFKQTPRVVDRNEIMTEVWGLDSEMSHRSIDNIIVKIRSTLAGAGSCIRTVRGRGYQWIP